MTANGGDRQSSKHGMPKGDSGMGSSKPTIPMVTKCRYCGKAVFDRKLAEHIAKRCPKAPR